MGTSTRARRRALGWRGGSKGKALEIHLDVVNAEEYLDAYMTMADERPLCGIGVKSAKTHGWVGAVIWPRVI